MLLENVDYIYIISIKASNMSVFIKRQRHALFLLNSATKYHEISCAQWPSHPHSQLSVRCEQFVNCQWSDLLWSLVFRYYLIFSPLNFSLFISYMQFLTNWNLILRLFFLSCACALVTKLSMEPNTSLVSECYCCRLPCQWWGLTSDLFLSSSPLTSKTLFSFTLPRLLSF